MDFREFQRRFDGSDLAPIYVIVDGEAYFTRRALRMIRKAAIGDADPALCLSEFNGTQAQPEDVLGICRTAVMFGPRRLVVVRNAGAFLQKHAKAMNAYFKSPASRNCLVLIVNKKSKRAAKGTVVVECKKVYERGFPRFLADRSREVGKRLTPEAAATLQEHVGENLEALDQQLHHLALYVGDRPVITGEDVEALVASDRVRVIWDLSDAVAARRTRTALATLNRLMREGMQSPSLIGLLARQFNALLRARAFLDRGLNRRDAEQSLHMHPFRAQKIVQQAATLSRAYLVRGYRLLVQADRQSKTTSADTGLLLESLVIRLCS